MRALLHDSAYSRTIIVKNILYLILTVGGAWWFKSARIALAGICLSVAAALLSSWRALKDAGASPAKAQPTLAREFMRYGLPPVAASMLFQFIPLATRVIVRVLYAFV